jgi:uncharacterized damage-inducible protein DinB
LAEDRTALAEHYRKARAELEAAIDGLSDERMLETSLDGWSVTDHLAHIAAWDEVRAAEIRRIGAGHASAWRMTGAQDEAYNTMAYELRRGFSSAQARWELAQTEEALLDAIAAVPDRALEASLYGEAGLVSDHASEHAGWIRRWRSERGY